MGRQDQFGDDACSHNSQIFIRTGGKSLLLETLHTSNHLNQNVHYHKSGIQYKGIQLPQKSTFPNSFYTKWT